MTTTAKPRTRLSAEERREEILQAATEEFAQGGLDGTPTDAIAKRAGISQPYLFRLFRTKKELFMAAVERAFRRMAETMDAAAVGVRDDGERARRVRRLRDALQRDCRDEPARLQRGLGVRSRDRLRRTPIAPVS